MEILLPRDHIIYSSADDVDQICAPLKKTFGVTTFSYLKINPDYSRVHLENNPEWTEFFFKKVHDYYEASEVTECQHWHSGYAPLHMLAEEDCIKDAQEFNIGNGVVISDRIDGCTELVYFALPHGASNLEIFSLLNNIDLLKKFISYFKQRVAAILDQAAKNPIVLPFLKPNSEINNFSIVESLKYGFLNSINSGVLCSNRTRLTQKELECLQYIQKGYTAKMIARELGVSHRTVEHHLAHIRKKIEVNSIKQLLLDSH